MNSGVAYRERICGSGSGFRIYSSVVYQERNRRRLSSGDPSARSLKRDKHTASNDGPVRTGVVFHFTFLWEKFNSWSFSLPG